MKDNKFETFDVRLKAIAERLEICQQVKEYDTPDEKQAWMLAHNLLDLEESFQTFLDQQLPKLEKEELNSDQINDILFEIGEELRHVLYHIRDAEFYSYLRD